MERFEQLCLGERLFSLAKVDSGTWEHSFFWGGPKVNKVYVNRFELKVRVT